MSSSFSPGATAYSANDPNGLLASNHDVYTRKVTIISGQNLTKGAVLGKITASGKFNRSASAAGDGSETPKAILADDCDASGGDKTAVVYFAGGFKESQLNLGAGHTLASIAEDLAARGIFLYADYSGQ